MRRLALLAFALSAVLFAGAAGRDRFDAWVAATDLPALIPDTGVEMHDDAGHLLRAYTVADGRWRMAVQPDTVDPGFVALLLAFEDRRFYRHSGVDLRALIRAAAQSARAGRVVSGGSTLTMQVARLLEDSGTGALRGKLRQMRVAWALEQRLDKAAILSLYLHLAPYGGNIEGVRAATLAWFGKEPRRLTPAEAALLVALPQSPTARRPDRHPAAARAARDRVLALGVARGVLAPGDAVAARTAGVPDRRVPVPRFAPHLTDRLRADRPEQRLHRLTIRRDLQASLERLARQAAQQMDPRLSAAVIVVDHATGAVHASVGSAGAQADARLGFVDMTRAVRSPGSTLKPLVYGLAFDAALVHPDTMIEDRPMAFGAYAPENFDRHYRGTIRVRTALQVSLNIPVVALTEALGPARLMAALRKAGTAPRLPGTSAPGLAVALGGVGMTLEDLVTLYAAIARGGASMPLQYRKDAAHPDPVRVLSPEAAWHLGDILRDVPPPPNGAPGLAYKTGTSYGHRDSWAIGYDGRYVVGVWLGRADGTPVPGAFGASVAAPFLFDAFQRVTAQRKPLPPPPPATLIADTADLPLPLQRFRPVGQGMAQGDGPEIAFPPDGAVLVDPGAALTVKLRRGTPPFVWMLNGAPVVIGAQRRITDLPNPGPGFATLSVIDAAGRSRQVRVEVRP